MRYALVGAAFVAAVGIAQGASAQLPDSIVVPRLDSASMCPQVFVRQDPQLHSWSIETSPITKRVAGRDLAMVISALVLPGGWATMGSVQFMSMGDGGARYRAAHDIVIVGDDSIRLRATTKYEDQSPSSNVHIETIPGQLLTSDLARLANANRITVNLGNESHILSIGQVQAVRALVRAMREPLTAREVATGCRGPNRAELEAKWAMMNSRLPRNDSVVLVDGDSIRVGNVIMRKVASKPIAPTTFALPASASRQVYTESQVDKPVRNPDGKPVPKTVPPEVVAIVGGEELLEFVVNADGKVEPGTVRLVKASDSRVASMPLGNLSDIFFIPAELHGQRVRQAVQLAMPVGIRSVR